jgi:hypothetical protein
MRITDLSCRQTPEGKGESSDALPQLAESTHANARTNADAQHAQGL